MTEKHVKDALQELEAVAKRLGLQKDMTKFTAKLTEALTLEAQAEAKKYPDQAKISVEIAKGKVAWQKRAIRSTEQILRGLKKDLRMIDSTQSKASSSVLVDILDSARSKALGSVSQLQKQLASEKSELLVLQKELKVRYDLSKVA